MLRICSLNLLFNGIKSPILRNKNSLSNELSEEWKNKFTLIFSNPPFGGISSGENIAEDLFDKANTKKIEILFFALYLKIGVRVVTEQKPTLRLKPFPPEVFSPSKMAHLDRQGSAMA